jgi:hypothetical protein
MAQVRQDYLNENERLTNLLLEAEDRIQELESTLLMTRQPEQESDALRKILTEDGEQHV